MQADSKFLAVGFMKTGLSSLLTAMRTLGYRCRNKHNPTFWKFVQGDYAAVLEQYETADFFIGWPHQMMYAPFVERYGDRARVILTERDPEDWYRSLLTHNRYANPFTHKHRVIFGRSYPHGFRDEHIRLYRSHNAQVKAFFAERGLEDRFLVLRTGESENLERLLAFIGRPGALDAYPRRNRTEDRVTRHPFDLFRLWFNRAVQPVYGQWAPRLFPEPGPRLRPVPPGSIATRQSAGVGEHGTGLSARNSTDVTRPALSGHDRAVT